MQVEILLLFLEIVIIPALKKCVQLVKFFWLDLTYLSIFRGSYSSCPYICAKNERILHSWILDEGQAEMLRYQRQQRFWQQLRLTGGSLKVYQLASTKQATCLLECRRSCKTEQMYSKR